MQTTGHAVLVDGAAVLLIACLAGEVLGLWRVLNVATSSGKDIKSASEFIRLIEDSSHISPTTHLGHTKPRSSTSRNRPWTEFRQIKVASFLVRELFGLLFFQISGCSRFITNSESLSNLNGPSWNDNRGQTRMKANSIGTYKMDQEVRERKKEYQR